MNLEKEFIPYEQALELKELGFDEPCFKMSEHRKACEEQLKPEGCQLHNLHCGYPDCTIDKSITPIPLPTFSQCFRWFREKYDLRIWIESNHGILHFEYVIATTNPNFINKQFNDFSYHKTHEEAELACLKKLIEIVKNKQP